MRQSVPAQGHYEPSLEAVFLPGCACGAPHPLALKFKPLDTAHCTDCGAAVAGPAPAQTVRAKLTGRDPWSFLARLFLWIGEAFAKLSKRL